MKKVEQEYLGKSADFESAAVPIEQFRAFSAQINVHDGNSLDANVALQVCNDELNWVDVTGTLKTLSGTTDTQMYDVIDSAVAYVRIRVEIVSGDADFDIDWVLKD